MSAMERTDTAFAAGSRVENGLEALRIALGHDVGKDMRKRHGNCRDGACPRHSIFVNALPGADVNSVEGSRS